MVQDQEMWNLFTERRKKCLYGQRKDILSGIRKETWCSVRQEKFCGRNVLRKMETYVMPIKMPVSTAQTETSVIKEKAD